MKEFRTWNELLMLPVAIILYALSNYYFPKIDPEAGTYDIGIFQAIILATIALYIGKVIIWLALKIGAPYVYDTIKHYLFTSEKEITRWQKGIYSLVYFFGLFFFCVLLLKAFI